MEALHRLGGRLKRRNEVPRELLAPMQTLLAAPSSSVSDKFRWVLAGFVADEAKQVVVHHHHLGLRRGGGAGRGGPRPRAPHVLARQKALLDEADLQVGAWASQALRARLV